MRTRMIRRCRTSHAQPPSVPAIAVASRIRQAWRRRSLLGFKRGLKAGRRSRTYCGWIIDGSLSKAIRIDIELDVFHEVCFVWREQVHRFDPKRTSLWAPDRPESARSQAFSSATLAVPTRIRPSRAISVGVPRTCSLSASARLRFKGFSHPTSEASLDSSPRSMYEDHASGWVTRAPDRHGVWRFPGTEPEIV